MRRLARLAASRDLQLLLTSVTVQEIRAHLEHDAKEALRVLRNYRRASKLVKRVLPDPLFVPEDEQEFRKGLHDEFDRFLLGAHVEVVSVAHVSPEAVLADYFASVAPFATGDKKSE
ncbi:MAG: PIN domain-containing protein, partial [Fimbriimonadaceae bacterium]